MRVNRHIEGQLKGQLEYYIGKQIWALGFRTRLGTPEKCLLNLPQVSNPARLRLGPKDWDAPEGDDEEDGQDRDLVTTTLTKIVNRQEGDSPPSSKRYACDVDIRISFINFYLEHVKPTPFSQ